MNFDLCSARVIIWPAAAASASFPGTGAIGAWNPAADSSTTQQWTPSYQRRRLSAPTAAAGAWWPTTRSTTTRLHARTPLALARSPAATSPPRQQRSSPTSQRPTRSKCTSSRRTTRPKCSRCWCRCRVHRCNIPRVIHRSFLPFLHFCSCHHVAFMHLITFGFTKLHLPLIFLCCLLFSSFSSLGSPHSCDVPRKAPHPILLSLLTQYKRVMANFSKNWNQP